ncbi:MAG TPA: hypothetical protein VGD67_18600 [Pseudonocardiaceae bacterium]
MSLDPTAGRRWPLAGGDAPVEIKAAAGLLVGGGALFVITDLVLAAVEEDTSALLLVPLLQLGIGIGIAGGLLRGSRIARYAGLLFALTFALLHMLFALQGVALWIRIVTGVIAASQVYVAVLLNTRPALLHTGGRVRR